MNTACGPYKYYVGAIRLIIVCTNAGIYLYRHAERVENNVRSQRSRYKIMLTQVTEKMMTFLAIIKIQ